MTITMTAVTTATGVVQTKTIRRMEQTKTGKAYTIDTYAVIDSAEDTATSSLQRPSTNRKFRR